MSKRSFRTPAEAAAVISRLKDILGEIYAGPPPTSQADLDTLAVEARLGADKIPKVLTWVDVQVVKEPLLWLLMFDSKIIYESGPRYTGSTVFTTKVADALPL